MNIEMPLQDVLLQELQEGQDESTCPYSPHLKSAILGSLFGCKYSTDSSAKEVSMWGGYFEYYFSECVTAMSVGRLHWVLKTHKDIVRIVEMLRDPESTRESIKDKEKDRMATSHPQIDDQVIYGAIDLAARLGFMTLIGSSEQVYRGEERCVTWSSGRLEAVLAVEFSGDGLLKKEHVKLERLFNACNLDRIAGLQIIWTHNLANHLRVQNDDKEVSIFHYASFLNSQKTSAIFPQGFIDETIQTLALLFPQFDDDCNVWFKKRAKQESLDTDVTKCGQLAAEDRQIEGFHFWRDRLIILKQVFDEAEPRGLKRWWRDRRKPVQWYNFWLAVALIVGLTFFFGVVQSVEGAMQVYKAYHPSS